MFGKKFKPGEKEYKIIDTTDTLFGPFNTYKQTIKSMSSKGWVLEKDEDMEKSYYSGSKGLILGLIFLPLALFGGKTKNKNKRRLTFSRIPNPS